MSNIFTSATKTQRIQVWELNMKRSLVSAYGATQYQRISNTLIYPNCRLLNFCVDVDDSADVILFLVATEHVEHHVVETLFVDFGRKENVKIVRVFVNVKKQRLRVAPTLADAFDRRNGEIPFVHLLWILAQNVPHADGLNGKIKTNICI